MKIKRIAMKKTNWKVIFKVIIAVATAIAGVIGGEEGCVYFCTVILRNQCAMLARKSGHKQLCSAI